ncbi:TetR/AcrR family transcriptional regulator [Isoptericola sp. NPDC057653]|uniref:TetR/AcrR family transcriptional regulator n=1 Tax=Isoptericola sp. NPDC057653 TaxID=3346195 RepID=UPI00369A4B0D
MAGKKQQTAVRREQILRAALELTDEVGVERLSMRTVAERVSLSAMGLYRHFADKAEILDALVGRVLADVATGDLPAEWRPRLHAVAQQLLDAAVRHPEAFLLVLNRPYRAPEAIRVMEATYGILRDAGVDPDQLPRVERLVSTALIGYAAAVGSGAFWSGGSPDGPPMEPGAPEWRDELRRNVDDLGAVILRAR